MKNSSLILLFILTFPAGGIKGQEAPDNKGFISINQAVIQAQLEFLSSDWMEGRRAGEKGELVSSDYIASMLKLYGVKPWGDKIPATNLSYERFPENRSFFQNFALIKSTPVSGQSLKLITQSENSTETKEFTWGVDFSVRPESSVEIKAPVIFAGYAFKNDRLNIDEITGLDVKGKFILKISGLPTFARQKLSSEEIEDARNEFYRYAMQNGAAGIIEFNPSAPVLSASNRSLQETSPSERNPRPYDVYSSYAIAGDKTVSDLLRISVSASAAQEILRGTKVDYQDYINKADKHEKYLINPLTNKFLDIKTLVETSSVNVRNVVGIIEGDNTKEFIVIGAHYDHMGSNRGYIWNGADDNGSGTVAVMTLARALIETGKKPEKTIVIALWTAEEEGLLGSEYFVKHFGNSAGRIALNVNFDMISRYISEQEKNKVVMTYTSSEKGFRDLTINNIKKYGIDLDVDYQPSDNPPGGSDHRSFVAAGIPVMRFKPGHREEYHTPADEINTVDWDIMEKIIKISYANIWQLANSQ